MKQTLGELMNPEKDDREGRREKKLEARQPAGPLFRWPTSPETCCASSERWCGFPHSCRSFPGKSWSLGEAVQFFLQEQVSLRSGWEDRHWKSEDSLRCRADPHTF